MKPSNISDAEWCRRNGWTVGTRLAGDGGYGPTVIQITAIGESAILAKTRGGVESVWSLDHRDWRPVPQHDITHDILAEAIRRLQV